MKVILVYDINLDDDEGPKRLNKIRKVARRYLVHIQKSVFEGELTLGRIAKMRQEINGVIEENKDSVILYVMPDGVKWDRIFLGLKEDPARNVL